MEIQRERLYQLFKYAVYLFLALDVYLFFIEEFAAAQVQFPSGIALSELMEAYVATIDTAAWVVLLLMFELETYVLDDRHFTKRIVWSLHFVRVVCYSAIVYSFFGYVVNLATINAIVPLPGVTDLCTMAGEQWSYAVDLDEYEALTMGNCSTLSNASSFFQFTEFSAAVDAEGLANLKGLAWVDVINSGVWLLVVIILEMDVWLQERNRLQGTIYRVSYTLKFVFYATLLGAAIYWSVKGDFVDAWDAFIWLVAFVFIELNVVQWRDESMAETAT